MFFFVLTCRKVFCIISVLGNSTRCTARFWMIPGVDAEMALDCHL